MASRCTSRFALQRHNDLTPRWQAGLYNAGSPYQPTAETGLIKLLPGLLNILSENMDLLKTLFALLDSYLLLDAPGIIQVRYNPTAQFTHHC
jgi:hypothetical protein